MIKASDNSSDNIYVKDVIFNGRKITDNFFRHSDLQKGGTLIFRMSPDPEKKRGTKEENFPYSMSK